MTEDDRKRLVSWAVASFMLTLIMFMILTAYFTVEIKKLHDTIAFQTEQIRGEIPNVKDGRDGSQGVNGSMGTQGLQGTSGTPGVQGARGETGATGAQGVQGEVGPQGPQGEAGPQGQRGNAVFTRTNPITGGGECRYAGDDEWQPEEECQ